MNALYVILSFLFGLNIFGGPSGKKAVKNAEIVKSPLVTNQGGPAIINANPGTVVVLDDTHFSPPR
jgi:hypothetical protein